ncbi:GAF domain-containing protein [Bradyrhizobium arachidis]|uniref:GAF domain-containing sensor histidine kinase n=1 Tax=Bradyrhizobium TaxID=374 RepID=UPI002162A44B|nr:MULTISPECIES: GAF domain-containing protein [Bradyrhizobium]MDN4983206.1 GAF domain-containing protein [Bradyrhizobium sp. WYCCWR 13022]UVO34717.1 GAF domain-containing protein [Bradyrhizobium arachidis]
MTALAQDADIARQTAELEQRLQSSAAETERLRHELALSRERQTAGADILATIASTSGDADHALQQIAETTARLFGASSVSIQLAENGEWGKAYRYGASAQRIRAAVPLTDIKVGGRNMPGAVVGRNQQIHAPDLDNLEGDLADFPGLPHARAAGTRTICGTPLRSKGRAIGSLIVHRDRLEPFSDEELALQQSFADQAAIAIENARLFNETRETLQQQTATADVLKVISRSAFDLETVLNTLTESAARLCNADMAAITRQQADGGYAHATRYNFAPEWDRVSSTVRLYPGRGSLVGRVLLEGKAVQITDVLIDPEYAFPEQQRAGGYRTLLGVPLLREGQPIGVLFLGRATVNPFSNRQIELVQSFADQAVIAIENVRLFDEVQARTRELAQSLEDLRAAQDRLIQTEKLASLGQLTAGIAHEIKNPLNFVNNFAALSAELTDELNEVLAPVPLGDALRNDVDELTGMLKDNLQKVVQHGKRADSIVKNMLLHSREGGGEHRLSDINALVEESLNLSYHGARAEQPQFDVTLKRTFDPAAGSAEVFPQEITRVLLNLVSNGFYAVAKRKAESGAGTFEPVVTVTTRDRGDTIEIRIRDNGTGIPDDVKAKMFNPFFTTKPAGEGTGLGLSMSHDIVVKQHGGTIDVATEPGQFTEFTIVLPRKSGFVGGGG